MSATFLILAFLVLVSAALAMIQSKVIYSALMLVGTWLGIAGLYLWAGTEFTAFAQVIVYVGAVSMIALFAVLLTGKGDEVSLYDESSEWRWRTFTGVLTASAISGLLTGAVLSSRPALETGGDTSSSVKDIGIALASHAGDALLVVGAILTVALLGAVIIASFKEKASKEDPT